MPDSVIPLSTYMLYLIPEYNFHVIPDSVIPVSVITLSTSLLYPIPLYPILLCLIPFPYVIPDSVMPDSVIPESVMTGSPSPIPHDKYTVPRGFHRPAAILNCWAAGAGGILLQPATISVNALFLWRHLEIEINGRRR